MQNDVTPKLCVKKKSHSNVKHSHFYQTPPHTNPSCPILYIPYVVSNVYSFQISFIVTQHWLQSHSITNSDVLQHGLEMKVFLVQTLQCVVDCPVCQKNGILTVKVSNSTQFLSPQCLDDGQLWFKFDLCRVKCSSSYNHFNDELYVSLMFNESLIVSSSPFVIKTQSKFLSIHRKPKLIGRIHKIVVTVDGNRSDIGFVIKDCITRINDYYSVDVHVHNSLTLIYIHVDEFILNYVEYIVAEISNSTLPHPTLSFLSTNQIEIQSKLRGSQQ
ncbi:Programmed cell death protein 2 C-terminal domain-containing protein [Entamoeba marina]